MKNILFILFLLIALTEILPQDKIVTEFSGSNMKNTRPFQVSGSWEIKWDFEGDIFSIYLYTEDGELVTVAANQSGSGQGSSFQPKGGRYYLAVNAMGEWEIKIYDLDEETTSKTVQSGNVLDISGDGIKTTRPFSVKKSWEIQWDADGDFFSIYVYSSNGDLIGVAANQSGPGAGDSFQPKKGKYYLTVNAMGKWRMKVVEIK